MAHVLIVDDDEDVRMSMRAIMEDAGGHTVVEAPDGLTARAMLRASERPLIVLLDLLMPGHQARVPREPRAGRACRAEALRHGRPAADRRRRQLPHR